MKWHESECKLQSLLTSVLDSLVSQAHVLAALPPGKVPQVPTEQDAVWVPQLVWMLCTKDIPLVPADNRYKIPTELTTEIRVQ
jgi:hypothetical protein